MNNNSGSVKSVEKAFDLLSCFLGKEKQLSLKELSVMTGWPKSTIYNLLSAMRKQGVIIQNEDDGKYSMGIRMFQLGSAVEHISRIVHIAKPLMDDMAELAGRSVHLATLNYPKIILVSKSEPASNLLKMIVPIGVAMPMYCTAHGKLFLSEMPDHRVDEYLQSIELKAYTSKAVTDPVKLRDQFRKIRENGFAVEKGERNMGMSGVAAPIRDTNGRIVYSIGIVGLFSDIHIVDFQSATSAVVDAAYIISKMLNT